MSEHEAGDAQQSEHESQPMPQGLFDGFEGYRTASVADFQAVLTGGIVVPDANLLLNLYRYSAPTRADLLAVLQRIKDQLWVPHQVAAEFWRNRASALRDPKNAAAELREVLEEAQTTAETSLRRWINRVSVPRENQSQLLDQLRDGFAAVLDSVRDFTDEDTANAARNTSDDPVLIQLEAILRDRVGTALPPNDHKAALVEAMRRVDAKEPPGYKDRGKEDAGAAGDYLVWEQTIREAARRNKDVLFVTGDAKEDWWRIEAGERRGPRLELVNELRTRANVRLLMIQPQRLLDLGRELLDVQVRRESVEDVERVDRLLGERRDQPAGGWTKAMLDELLERLSVQAAVQAEVIRTAARQEGFVTREEVYRIGIYDSERSLRGFTRPVNRLVAEFRDRGMIPAYAVDVLTADYDPAAANPGSATGFRIPEVLIPLIDC